MYRKTSFYFDAQEKSFVTFLPYASHVFSHRMTTREICPFFNKELVLPVDDDCWLHFFSFFVHRTAHYFAQNNYFVSATTKLYQLCFLCIRQKSR